MGGELTLLTGLVERREERVTSEDPAQSAAPSQTQGQPLSHYQERRQMSTSRGVKKSWTNINNLSEPFALIKLGQLV